MIWLALLLAAHTASDETRCAPDDPVILQATPTVAAHVALTKKACALIELDTAIEDGSIFVDTRLPPRVVTVPGADVLSLAQTNERYRDSGLAVVLLGNGMDDVALANACGELAMQETADVVRGGVRAWHRGQTKEPDAEELFATASAAQAIGYAANAGRIIWLTRDAKLVQASVRTISVPMTLATSAQKLTQRMRKESSELTFVVADSAFKLTPKNWPLAWFLVNGGSDAFAQEIKMQPTRALAASMPLKRPCYLP
jgi:hypothetical protein